MPARADRVPDWLVERLAAGELPERQAADLLSTLRAHGEDARLSALEASNAEILKTLPPASAVAEIERRAVAAQRQPTPRRPRLLLAWSLAATCAAGLVVFLMVRGQPGVGPGSAHELAPEHIGVKGGPSLRIHRKTKTGAESIHAHAMVRQGDTLQLGYVAAGKRFGVIASIDARGTFTLHLPEAPGPAAPLAKGGEHALPHAYELDDAPGFEKFVLVTSDRPFTTDAVAAALRQGRPLPADLSAVDMTLKKESP